MKVMCIEANIKVRPGENSKPVVIYGGIYTVIDSGAGADQLMPCDWYELLEHAGYVYGQHLFIPLSQISETDMVREYNKEKV